MQAAVSAVVFHVSHMGLSVILKWVLVQRFSAVDGVCCTTSWFGFRKQVCIIIVWVLYLTRSDGTSQLRLAGVPRKKNPMQERGGSYCAMSGTTVV